MKSRSNEISSQLAPLYSTEMKTSCHFHYVQFREKKYIELFTFREKALGAIHGPLAENSRSRRLEVGETLKNDTDVRLFLFVSPHF